MFVLAEQKMILSNNGYVLPNRNWESCCFNHDGKGTFTTFETDCDSINPPADGMMVLIEFHPVGMV